MTENNKGIEKPPVNPLFPLIDSKFHIGSVRELIYHAIGDINTWDLPEDPEELKKVLNEAIDRAVLLKKPH